MKDKEKIFQLEEKVEAYMNPRGKEERWGTLSYPVRLLLDPRVVREQDGSLDKNQNELVSVILHWEICTFSWGITNNKVSEWKFRILPVR